MQDGTVLPGSRFAFNEPSQIVEVSPVLGIGFSGQRSEVFLTVR
jgi:hypothetical protein